MVAGSGFILEHYPVTQEQYDYILGLDPDWGPGADSYRLFCHVLASSLLQWHQVGEEGWIPVSADLIKKCCPSEAARIRGMIYFPDLLEVKEHDRKQKLSREFRVSPAIRMEFLSRGPKFGLASNSWEPPVKVNLFTGQTISVPQHHKLHDENRNEAPDLVRKAIQVFKTCVFVPMSVEAYLEELKEAASIDKRLKEKLISDTLCYQAVLYQEPKPSTRWKYVYSFPPAYTSQAYGRISHVGGGLQTASRRMKAAAYQEIPSLKNYDVRAAHPTILLQMMEGAGINSSWLDAYLGEPEAKQRYSDRLGIPVTIWKRCFSAVLMGGSVKKVSRPGMSKLQDVLLTAVNEDAQAYEKLSNAFRETVSPLLKDLDALFEYYKGVYIPEVSYRASKGQKFIKNACGMTLNVTEWSTRSLGAQRKTLFPFLLQGTEAAFIHHLTLLGETYSYEPIANEHDGLITIGPIPEQAVEQARALSGFHYAELEIKPFVEQSDRYPLSGVSSNAS